MVLLDTSVLIDLLRGHRPALDYLVALSEPPACSEISRAEVIRGLRSRERPAAELLFAEIAWHGVDQSVARHAGELGREHRRSHPGIGIADLLIAATAILLDASLATANVRHFPMFDDLAPPYPG